MSPQLQKKTDLLKSKYALASLFSGGPEGDRTLDLRVANAALSQLSHEPSKILNYYKRGDCLMPPFLLLFLKEKKGKMKEMVRFGG